jgi:hypothetical protein
MDSRLLLAGGNAAKPHEAGDESFEQWQGLRRVRHPNRVQPQRVQGGAQGDSALEAHACSCTGCRAWPTRFITARVYIGKHAVVAGNNATPKTYTT